MYLTSFKTILKVVVTIFLFFSCVHSREIATSPADYKTEIELKSKKASAIINYRNGDNQNAKAIKFFGDSLKYDDTFNSIERVASIRDIQSIRFQNRTSGALEGGAIGIVSGLAIGVVLGLSSGDDPPGFMSFSASDKAALYGIMGAALGALAGLPSGYASGSYIVYDFPDEKTDSISRVIIKNKK